MDDIVYSISRLNLFYEDKCLMSYDSRIFMFYKSVCYVSWIGLSSSTERKYSAMDYLKYLLQNWGFRAWLCHSIPNVRMLGHIGLVTENHLIHNILMNIYLRTFECTSLMFEILLSLHFFFMKKAMLCQLGNDDALFLGRIME